MLKKHAIVKTSLSCISISDSWENIDVECVQPNKLVEVEEHKSYHKDLFESFESDDVNDSSEKYFFVAIIRETKNSRGIQRA